MGREGHSEQKEPPVCYGEKEYDEKARKKVRVAGMGEQDRGMGDGR